MKTWMEIPLKLTIEYNYFPAEPLNGVPELVEIIDAQIRVNDTEYEISSELYQALLDEYESDMVGVCYYDLGERKR